VLENEIDRSLRWLRGRFDPGRKGYGGLEADALVLLAFAESPRGYHVGDGPFIAAPLAALLARQEADGSFGSEPRTRLVLEVLWALGVESEHAAVIARAQSSLRAQEDVAAPMSAQERLEQAIQLLERRHPDGSWGEGDGVLEATATNTRRLSELHRQLKAQEEKLAPREARPLPAFDAAQAAEVERALERGARYLLTQVTDGGWGFDGRRDAGITAMVASALLALPEPRPAEVQQALARALDWLVSLQQEDGSIHDGQLANYVTSAAILALSRAGRAADEPVIARAREFLQALQADEGEGYSARDRYYGGVGYGGDERPDLSNMQMALEALAAAGTLATDPTFRKALVFLQRCQNRSESNDLSVVEDGQTIASGDDGGAGYAPGESKAGFIELPDGRRIPRSYGSMSYALLKGYLFAGLPKEDPRVQAVWKWLRENYTLDTNPGFQTSDDPSASYQGLFYYFYTLAKALDLYGEERVRDAAGAEHDWRGELCGRLAAMQRQDGSWINENAARWFEGNPVLATAYAMTTLGTARGR
jgi:squalene-hopene/tetraprenyl-beta-curcumene cyclase